MHRLKQGGCALTPALSDANWETVWEVTLGWAAAAYARTDPSYAAELWSAWEASCAPIGLEPSPPNQLGSVLWIGCTHADECTDGLKEPYLSNSAPVEASSSMLSDSEPEDHASPINWSSKRSSAMLSGCVDSTATAPFSYYVHYVQEPRTQLKEVCSGHVQVCCAPQPDAHDGSLPGDEHNYATTNRRT